jgi:hypothetical protein
VRPAARLALARASRLKLRSHSPAHILAAGGVRHPALLLASNAATASAARLAELGWVHKLDAGYDDMLEATLVAAERLDENLGFDTTVLWRRARWRWRRRALLASLKLVALVSALAAPVLLRFASLGTLAAFAVGAYAVLVVTAGPPSRVVDLLGDHPTPTELLEVLEHSGALRPHPAADQMPAVSVLDPRLSRLVADRLDALDPAERSLAETLAPQLPGSVADLLGSVRVLQP